MYSSAHQHYSHNTSSYLNFLSGKRKQYNAFGKQIAPVSAAEKTRRYCAAVEKLIGMVICRAGVMLHSTSSRDAKYNEWQRFL